ncbi:hypothetical protein Afil01_17570 [Actinorhabdospora filicis]|uniref:DUF4241 domain-containing protein n=1 Tax=Actinorhabdospora filicis TaxID=1785913 RepID=A0A9W6SJ80_9ACTN|nr:DUF4241 domain-containing protein [Actinorhabdospora filicis]GLZ76950.1 hypothetical protein Afil01_17570 [Actinorhabdospora filicis]
MPLTLRYCDGWDWDAGEQVGWWTAADALAADREGRQYSVLVLDGDTPIAVVDVAWHSHYLAVSHMDDRRRRTRKTVYRRLRDDAMFPTRDVEWRYRPDQRHGDADVWQRETTRTAHGRVHVATQERGARGGLRTTVATKDIGSLWRALPRAEEPEGFAPDATVTEPDDGSRFGKTLPWHPPVPLTVPYLDALLTPGTTVAWPKPEDKATIRWWRPATGLNLPTGRVLARDPLLLGSDTEKPFAAEVPPGTYPVVFAMAVREGETDEGPVAAVILRISEEPVVSWSLAVAEDQDPRTLGDREYFGFGVDTGMGCFTDAGNAPALAEYVEELYDITELIEETATITVPGTEANLIGWSCFYGDGDYPTWLGRDARGEVVCFVADMLILRSRP